MPLGVERMRSCIEVLLKSDVAMPFFRSFRFRSAAVAALLVSLATGCATAQGTFGNHARYSPAFEGYVMAKEDGSDDPGASATVLLLRDPVTGNKLRCREEVTEWRELYEDVATDHAHDQNAAVAAGITGGAVFGPLLAVQPVGGLVFAEALQATESLYDALKSDTGPELLAKGIGLFKRKRFSQASVMIERALAKDSSVGTADEAYLYLGLAYSEQGKTARARIALAAFIDRAGVRDVDAYRKAEATLKTLGVMRKPCGSTDPVDLYW
jgi:tetratricopeptide (TPR) repeat protein